MNKIREKQKLIARTLYRTLISSGRLFALVLIALFAWLRAEDPEILKLVRAKTFDIYQQIKPRSTENINSPIVIIDIDEKSLENIGQWPWQRTKIAELIDQARKNEAEAVALDFVMSEPDRTSLPELAQTIKGLDPKVKETIQRLPTNDSVVAAAIKKYGRVVVGEAPFNQPKEYSGKKLKASFVVRGKKPEIWTEKQVSLIRNLPAISEAAKGRGIFGVSQERVDGIVRRISLIISNNIGLAPSLVLETLKVAYGARSIVLIVDEQTGIQKVALQVLRPKRMNISVPTDERGRVWVYFKPHKEFKDQYISAVDLIEGRVPKEKLAGKIAFVGSSAQGLMDLRASPINLVLPGVEVHANLAENILLEQQLVRPADAAGLELLAAIGLGIFMIIFDAKLLGARNSLFLFLAISSGLIWFSWTAFANNLQLYDPVYPILVSFLCFSCLAYSNYTQEEKQRKEVRSAFSQYISPDLVKQLANDPSKLVLGGEMREMTFMFSDIRGFTSISELYDAEGLTRLINRFLTPITNVILNTNGTIDKYMGDCIMAFWNAPLIQKDHAKKACDSALEMITALAKLNKELKEDSIREQREHRPIVIGIGINTGEACVGNMGSDQRFDYSVLGDSVNLASRLEGQSKTYGVTCVVGDQTVELLDGFATLELDLVMVKGKTEAVRIHTLMGGSELSSNEIFLKLEPLHKKMIKSFRNQNWEQTRELITTLKELTENKSTGLLTELQGVYTLYEHRIEQYIKTPPEKDWTGVFVATSK